MSKEMPKVRALFTHSAGTIRVARVWRPGSDGLMRPPVNGWHEGWQRWPGMPVATYTELGRVAEAGFVWVSLQADHGATLLRDVRLSDLLG